MNNSQFKNHGAPQLILERTKGDRFYIACKVDKVDCNFDDFSETTMINSSKLKIHVFTLTTDVSNLPCGDTT
jgi:hypothetical protein